MRPSRMTAREQPGEPGLAYSAKTASMPLARSLGSAAETGPPEKKEALRNSEAKINGPVRDRMAERPPVLEDCTAQEAKSCDDPPPSSPRDRRDGWNASA